MIDQIDQSEQQEDSEKLYRKWRGMFVEVDIEDALVPQIRKIYGENFDDYMATRKIFKRDTLLH